MLVDMVNCCLLFPKANDIHNHSLGNIWFNNREYMMNGANWIRYGKDKHADKLDKAVGNTFKPTLVWFNNTLFNTLKEMTNGEAQREISE